MGGRGQCAGHKGGQGVLGGRGVVFFRVCSLLGAGGRGGRAQGGRWYWSRRGGKDRCGSMVGAQPPPLYPQPMTLPPCTSVAYDPPLYPHPMTLHLLSAQVRVASSSTPTACLSGCLTPVSPPLALADSCSGTLQCHQSHQVWGGGRGGRCIRCGEGRMGGQGEG